MSDDYKDKTALIVGLPRHRDPERLQEAASLANASLLGVFKSAHFVYGEPARTLAAMAHFNASDVIVCVIPKWSRACRAAGKAVALPVLRWDEKTKTLKRDVTP